MSRDFYRNRCKLGSVPQMGPILLKATLTKLITSAGYVSDPNVTGIGGGGWGDTYCGLLIFDLSDVMGRAISSAKLKLYRINASNETLTTGKYNVLGSAWDGNVNWPNRPTGCNNNVGTSFSSSTTANSLTEIDLTTIVQNWANGSVTNYGLNLTGTLGSYSNQYIKFYGRDQDVNYTPTLEVEF